MRDGQCNRLGWTTGAGAGDADEPRSGRCVMLVIAVRRVADLTYCHQLCIFCWQQLLTDRPRPPCRLHSRSEIDFFSKLDSTVVVVDMQIFVLRGIP